MNNAAGGEIQFEVELSGGEADLRSVLSLVVPAEAIHVDKPGASPPAQPAVLSKPIVADDHGGEIFFDPADWKKRQKAKAPAAPAAEAPAAKATVALAPGADSS